MKAWLAGSFVIFSASASFSLPALQKNMNCSMLQPVDFLEPLQALADFSLSKKVADSSFQIHVLSRDPGTVDCSASRISDSGLILTASHCLEKCLSSKLTLKPIFPSDPATFTRYPTEAHQQTCDITLNDGSTATAKILVTNPCSTYASREAQANPEQVQSEHHEIADCAKYGDIAILEVPTPFLKNKTCLPIKTDKPAYGTPVATLGFPDRTYRRASDDEAKDAYGFVQEFSKGEITTRNTCGENHQKIEAYTQRLAPYRYQTTVDAVHGSSGGPLFDTSGSILGVAEWTDVKVQNEMYECEGATFFTPTSYIKENAKAWNPSFNLSDVKSLKQNANGIEL